MTQKKHLPIVTKISFVLLALSLLTLLAACGGGGTGAASTPTVAPTPTTAPTAAPTDTPTPTAAPTTAPAANGNSITIANFAFAPASLTVKVGTKVTWTNNDSATHTVTDLKGAFDSGDLPTGQSFSFTFTKAGTYNYHCAIHSSMTATIIVQ
ncbi:MAG TPA: cupredoxin family copper-binding protein [Ktedonosporobacter sp.]|nr:cupredoxin family copper-binding protein [Ktedonosporobacter sp.]